MNTTEPNVPWWAQLIAFVVLAVVIATHPTMPHRLTVLLFILLLFVFATATASFVTWLVERGERERRRTQPRKRVTAPLGGRTNRYWERLEH